MCNRRSLLLILCLLPMLIAACTPPQTGSSSPEPSYVTIRVGFTEGYHTGPWLDVLIREFQDRNPGYRVEKVPLPTGARRHVLVQQGDVDVAPVLIPRRPPRRALAT